MYSYEDRIRAVELYIKLGKRVQPTIRQLGYPTKNALKGWYREYRAAARLAAWLCARAAQVLAGPEGAGHRALPRPRSMHRCHHEGAGLSGQRDA